jgi:hypothetical protein
VDGGVRLETMEDEFWREVVRCSTTGLLDRAVPVTIVLSEETGEVVNEELCPVEGGEADFEGLDNVDENGGDGLKERLVRVPRDAAVVPRGDIGA